MIAHSPRAPINMFKPEPTGFCDRCNFLYPLAALTEQRAWAGPTTVGLGIRVCPRCLDQLQQNGLRTIVITPDPRPLQNPRPGYTAAQMGPVPVQFVLDDDDAGRLDEGNIV
jgi:hypothetical protein